MAASEESDNACGREDESIYGGRQKSLFGALHRSFSRTKEMFLINVFNGGFALLLREYIAGDILLCPKGNLSTPSLSSASHFGNLTKVDVVFRVGLLLHSK